MTCHDPRRSETLVFEVDPKGAKSPTAVGGGAVAVAVAVAEWPAGLRSQLDHKMLIFYLKIDV